MEVMSQKLHIKVGDTVKVITGESNGQEADPATEGDGDQRSRLAEAELCRSTVIGSKRRPVSVIERSPACLEHSIKQNHD